MEKPFNPDAFIAAYEKWKATPEGQKRTAEVHERKVDEIVPLPPGWELDKMESAEDSKTYYNEKMELKVEVAMEWSAPIQYGGRQTIYVRKIEEPEPDDEEEEEELEGEQYKWTMFSESMEKPDWKTVVERANAKALEFMKKTH